MSTSNAPAEQTWLLLNSCAADSRARMSHLPAHELALLVLKAACGVSSSALSPSCGQRGSLSKTSPAVRIYGLTRSLGTWKSSGMRAYRSRLRQAMSEHRIADHAFSSSGLLPTLTRKGNHAKHPLRGGTPTGGDGLATALQVTGPMSPRWLEWFMGFPDGWTESASWQMPSCPSAPKSSGG